MTGKTIYSAKLTMTSSVTSKTTIFVNGAPLFGITRHGEPGAVELEQSERHSAAVQICAAANQTPEPDKKIKHLWTNLQERETVKDFVGETISRYVMSQGHPFFSSHVEKIMTKLASIDLSFMMDISTLHGVIRSRIADMDVVNNTIADKIVTWLADSGRYPSPEPGQLHDADDHDPLCAPGLRPIPDAIYYHTDEKAFFTTAGMRLGIEFHDRWYGRRRQFPQAAPPVDRTNSNGHAPLSPIFTVPIGIAQDGSIAFAENNIPDQCGNCAFERDGACRRFPPIHQWPTVAANEWCGEYQS